MERNFIVSRLKTLLFLPNDVIIRQGEDSFNLYFINRGQVEINMKKHSIVSKDYQKKLIEDYRAGKISVNLNQDSEKALDRDENPQQVNIEDEDGEKAQEGLASQKILQKVINEGGYFGEIGLITNLKRTATAVSNDYCTLSSMSKDDLMLAKDEYPIIFQQFRDNISKYNDQDF